MQNLAINRYLDEDTRLQEIVINGRVYSLHKSRSSEIVVTDTFDYSRVFAIYSKDFWDSLGEE